MKNPEHRAESIRGGICGNGAIATENHYVDYKYHHIM